MEAARRPRPGPRPTRTNDERSSCGEGTKNTKQLILPNDHGGVAIFRWSLRSPPKRWDWASQGSVSLRRSSAEYL